MGGRQGASLAAIGNWTACSRRFADVQLRLTKTAALLGPAPGRSALRENRRLPRAQVITAPARPISRSCGITRAPPLDPAWDSIRSDPPFEKIVEESKKPFGLKEASSP